MIGVRVKPYVIIVGGTGAPKFLCLLYYMILGLIFGRNRIEGSPHWGYLNLHTNYAKFEADVERLSPDVERPLILVGHSQGAVLIMMYCMNHPERDIRVVLINGPLHGTTRGSRKLPGALGEFHVDSAFMHGDPTAGVLGFGAKVDAWARGVGPEAVRHRVCCIVAVHDELVQPYTSGIVEGATTIVLPGFWEHFLTIFNPWMWSRLRYFLTQTPASIVAGAESPETVLAKAA